MVNAVKNVTEVKEVKTTMENFIETLKNIKGTTFIGGDTITEPTMRKTNNRFYGKVCKKSRIACITGADYENAVNNRMKRQISDEVRESALLAGVPENIINNYESLFVKMAAESVAEKPFIAAKRQWGSHMVIGYESKIVDGTPQNVPITSRILIEHTLKETGEYRIYLQVIVLHAQTPVYFWKESGIELTPEEIVELKTFIPDKEEGARQVGLIDKVIIRDYRIDNAKRVRMMKTDYVIQ